MQHNLPDIVPTPPPLALDDPRDRAAAWVTWRAIGTAGSTFCRLANALEGQLLGLWRLPPARRLDLLRDLGADQRHSAQRLLHATDVDPERALRQELAALRSTDQLLCRADAAKYPPALLELPEPPLFLYARGHLAPLLELPRRLAIVGSRRARVYHRAAIRDLVAALPGCLVVSGGARGADAAAHEACLRLGRPTVALLPSGLDRPSPPRHRELFERMAVGGGLLLSEYPLGRSALRYHYHRRNRLIAALGEATLVACAGPNSGTLITAP